MGYGFIGKSYNFLKFGVCVGGSNSISVFGQRNHILLSEPNDEVLNVCSNLQGCKKVIFITFHSTCL